MLIDGGRLIE